MDDDDRVRKDGQVKYGGKSINRFYIENAGGIMFPSAASFLMIRKGAKHEQ